jgi:hypothetical protein
LALNKQIKQDIQIYFGSRMKINEHRTGQIGDLTNPNHLGLFFCITSREELDEIRNLLGAIADSYRKITAYVFSHTSESIDLITNKSIFLFDFNDFNLFGKMKELLQERFENDRFDLLVSFIFKPDPFCRMLVSQIRADFKIGPDIQENDTLYDMLIGQPDEEVNYHDYFQQARHFASVLNLSAKPNHY